MATFVSVIAAGRKEVWILYVLLLLACVLPDCGIAKECTNSGVSHTLRYQLSVSKNASEKEEILSHHLHLNPPEESAWMELLSRKLLRRGGPREEFDWAVLYRRIKSPQGHISAGEDFLQELSLHDVRLDPDSRHGEAQRTNLEYLLMLDVDQLVWSFRKQAGLQYPGKPYGGWESPDTELRGHFVGKFYGY